MTLPIIHIFSLGGTIAMLPDRSGGATAQLNADDLVKAVPELSKVASLKTHNFLQVGSSNLTFDHMLALAKEIRAVFQEGADGVVITQGTDSMEEACFALDLLLCGVGPVLMTGAMRHPTLPGADGPANLLAAVTAAATRRTADAGVCVVMNDEIHAARFVKKGHTSNLSTFVSRDTGPIGHVVEGRVILFMRPERPISINLKDMTKSPRIRLWWATMSSDPAEIEALGAEADGLVVASFGGGRVPESHVPILAQLAKKMPIILAGRAEAGDINQSTYSYPGAEMDLISKGLIPAGHYDPLKARILLYYLVSIGASRTEIMAAFDA